MKKLSSFVLILVLIISFNVKGQEFNTGEIGLSLSQYGNIGVYAPALDSVLHIDRLSPVFGAGPEAVFSYWTDAEDVDTARSIVDPEKSDFELYSSIDNALSGDPPAIRIKIHIYGWEGEPYVVMKFNIINDSEEALSGYPAIEVLPKIADTYGDEVVEFYAESGVVDVYKAGEYHIGFKLLSAELFSLTSIAWYSGYSDNDSDVYPRLTTGEIDTLFDAGADGAVSYLTAPEVNLAAGDSTEIYYAIAAGLEKPELTASIASAEEKYGLITSVSQQDELQPKEFKLTQNYPNPFNPTTKINYSIPKESNVILKVFNSLGQEVRTLVNKNMNPGNYIVSFDASELSSGIYFYKIEAGDFQSLRKMILIK